jgi:hypothetical protein
MAPTQSDHYVALNHNEAEFRLLTFDRTKDGAIRGRLHVFPLSKRPTYVAISYTWGEEPPRRTIYLNGKKIRLRENIFQALKSILRLRARNRQTVHPLQRKLQLRGLSRKAAKCEYFWIDSICIDQDSITERNHQVGMMGQIFSNAEFVIAWLGVESDRSVEVMQAINIGPELKPVAFSLGRPPLPQHLSEMLDIFDSLKYWSRLWVVQEIMLAKDVLVSWGNQFLPWYKIINVGLCRCPRVPISFESFEYAGQMTNEYEENWVKLVMEKERRRIFSERDPGDPESSAGDSGSMKPPNLYALIVQFVGHGCLVPRDKVIGLLGLLPDDAAHLADYSTPKEEYFREVCKYAFTAAQINGEWAKNQFQRLLGESLGLSAGEYSVRISNQKETDLSNQGTPLAQFQVSEVKPTGLTPEVLSPEDKPAKKTMSYEEVRAERKRMSVLRPGNNRKLPPRSTPGAPNSTLQTAASNNTQAASSQLSETGEPEN